MMGATFPCFVHRRIFGLGCSCGCLGGRERKGTALRMFSVQAERLCECHALG